MIVPAVPGAIVRDGAWLTYVVAVVAGYAAVTWDRAHRTTILTLLGVAVFGVRARACPPLRSCARAGASVLPRLDRSRPGPDRPVVAIDGGDWSPLSATFFLPLFFASLSYPPRCVVATAALSLAAYAGAALLGGDAPRPSSCSLPCSRPPG